LDYVYRYPAGQYLLSPPAGLIDSEELNKESPILVTARRELMEETGLELSETDELFVISPFLFSTPGMTDESNALAGIVLHFFLSSIFFLIIHDISKNSNKSISGIREYELP